MDNNHILIVEDSLTQAMRLRYILEKEDLMVDVATNGREALDILRNIPINIVISDVMMPEMNGYELCKAMRADPKLSSIPVMLVTTLSDPTDVIRALEAGADNFLIKPYDESTLISRIKYIIANMEIRKTQGAEIGLEVYFNGRKYFLNSSRIQMIDLLLSTYESAIQKNEELNTTNQRLEEALDNIITLQKNYLQLLETNVDAIVVYDNKNLVRYANPSANAIFVSKKDSLLNKKVPFELDTSSDSHEIEVTDPDGQVLTLDGRTMTTDWDGEMMTLAVFRDMTEATRLRKELEQMSLEDDLTGLYNRRGFNLLADRMVRQSKRFNMQLFVLFADLDGLKHINDTLGHPEGDLAISTVASIMKKTFRETDILARMGGDEFAIMGMINELFVPDKLIKRFNQLVEEWNEKEKRQFKLSVSMGIETIDPSAAEPIETLLKRADEKMYANKLARKANRI